MIESALKLLNGDEEFQKNLPAIIEVFVEFYGEENRSYIEERFSSLVASCFNKPTEKKYIIDKAIEEVQDRYYKEFFAKYNIEYNEENRSIYLPYQLHKGGYSLIEKYQKYINIYNRSTQEKYEETVRNVMDELKRRYNFKLSFEELKARQGTEEFAKFLDSLPSYLQPYVESCFQVPYKDIQEERQKKILAEAISKIDPSVSLENFDELFENKSNNILGKIDSMSQSFSAMRSAFLEEIKPLVPFMEYCEKCNLLLDQIREKNFAQLILKYESILPTNEIAIIKEQIANNKPLNLSKTPVTESYFGNKLFLSSIIESFSEESNKILKEKPTEWKADSIRRDRIKFFNMNGIDKGKDYDNYANDPECQKLVPTQLVVEELLSSRQKTLEQSQIEYYQSLPDYKVIREKLDNLHLESKDEGFDPNLYENTLMCICPNIRKDENGCKVIPLGFFRLTQFNMDAADACIIHELNHVYELNYREDYPEYTEFSSGWDIVQQSKTPTTTITLEKDETKRDYELFNEIINELISQDIAHLMHSHGIYIFSPKEKAKVSGKSSYETSMFIIRDFYNTYLEDIKESRRTMSMDKLFAKVGEDNFNELNNLFHIFHENFTEFKLLNVINALNKGQETEGTRIYNSIIEKRNMILAKMREHTEDYNRNQGLLAS